MSHKTRRKTQIENNNISRKTRPKTQISKRYTSQRFKKSVLENEISYKIRGAIFNVYKEFGPGLFESVYVAALGVELKNQGLNCEFEVPVSVDYQGEQLGLGFRIDILVNKKVIIEVKSVENLAEVHHKQILVVHHKQILVVHHL
jgi:GxxExxY protein